MIQPVFKFEAWELSNSGDSAVFLVQLLQLNLYLRSISVKNTALWDVMLHSMIGIC